jgi:hypothetical protein
MQFGGSFCLQYLASTALYEVKWNSVWSNSPVGAVGGERGETYRKDEVRWQKVCLVYARKERYSPPCNRPRVSLAKNFAPTSNFFHLWRSFSVDMNNYTNKGTYKGQYQQLSATWRNSPVPFDITVLSTLSALFTIALFIQNYNLVVL